MRKISQKVILFIFSFLVCLSPGITGSAQESGNAGLINQIRAQRKKEAAKVAPRKLPEDKKATKILPLLRKKSQELALQREKKEKSLANLFAEEKFSPIDSVSDLVMNEYGLPDWSESFRKGIVNPMDLYSFERGELRLRRGSSSTRSTLVLMTSKRETRMTPAIYPHKSHLVWLTCNNCHSKIFKASSSREKISDMRKIRNGEFCGRCHGSVAFPLKECKLCHIDKQSFSGNVSRKIP